jgi:hypothetical protein
VADHQRLTIERYDALLAEDTGVYIMPVLQGYSPSEYISHIRQYGDRLKPGMWVGVGSVCKRNTNIMAIWMVLDAIKDERPDLRLHGFGLKKTSLQETIIRDLLYSADSMAWSFAARREGRNANDWREAKAFHPEHRRADHGVAASAEEGFDGLTCEWGQRNYVNPPFGSIVHQGKKKGPTAWVRKALDEWRKGKTVVLVYPIDKWVLMLLKAILGEHAKVRNLGDVRWLATEDGSAGKGTGRHIAAFILEPA